LQVYNWIHCKGNLPVPVGLTNLCARNNYWTRSCSEKCVCVSYPKFVKLTLIKVILPVPVSSRSTIH